MDAAAVLVYLILTFISACLLYMLIKAAVRDGILEAKQRLNVREERTKIAKSECPECGKIHDIDCPKCPHCGHINQKL